MTLREALAWATSELRAAGIATPERDARALVAKVRGIDPMQLSLMPDEPLGSTADQRRLDECLTARKQGMPVSKIIGRRAFWKHDFLITTDVLDPRPETEILVELALQEPFRKVLDMGVGSGCILISLLAERPEARGVGFDDSAEAVLIAGQNAEAIGVADRITLPMSDWWDDVGGRYDLIVSNPPYIAADEMGGLAPEVRDYDPRMALTDEGDGLGAYRKIAGGLADHLTPGGRVLLEIGPTQADAVSQLLRAAGLEKVETHADLDGRDRVVGARMPKSA
ncbi:Protein-N(5)-glutamine methyltransferase PrmC [Candidatus Rhodobacter oscarellae]|uniref:Release factor glutamine methyltransferase n=1 Tax=Candidatus Rhodobacter oscarellae TaxID=1675527 RepID=A0A0J9E1Y5_9RHOB|nr:peptide chain release factor N(5)-glutamine methyltransferase [Candidatus Rhodobacter lobularis]KMW56735.1 Protein-N(5)-glutamine methyltransferase PrmC [Candidatus Rhodobacter lobularis]